MFIAVIARALDNARSLLFSAMRLRTRGCATVAFDQAGHVVLVRLTYGPHVWSLPGGGVHRGETFRQAALREAHEEAGITVLDASNVRLLGLFARRQGNWHDDVAVYVAEGCVVSPVRTWEVAEVRAFDPRDLPSDVAKSGRRRIEEAIGIRQLTGDW